MENRSGENWIQKDVNEVTFLGYSESSKSYRVFIPESQTVQIAGDIIFDEKHKAEERHEPVEPSTLFMHPPT
jgi:hypothetical protein